MTDLTRLVVGYQSTGEGLQRIVAAVSPRIYGYPRAKRAWDEDAPGDFYLYFYPRLLRILMRFRDQGKPFEFYLASVIAWQFRNFCRERAMGACADKVAYQLRYRDGGQGEATLLRFAGMDLSKGERRGLLYLALKCAPSMDSMDLDSLAAMTGVRPEDFRALCSEVETRLEHQRERRAFFERRRSRMVGRITYLRIRADMVDQAYRPAIEERLRSLAKGLADCEKKLAGVRLAATNADVAAVLGIPKGTVDSAIWYLKRRLNA